MRARYRRTLRWGLLLTLMDLTVALLVTIVAVAVHRGVVHVTPVAAAAPSITATGPAALIYDLAHRDMGGKTLAGVARTDPRQVLDSGHWVCGQLRHHSAAVVERDLAYFSKNVTPSMAGEFVRLTHRVLCPRT
jgi:hypothetical protein